MFYSFLYLHPEYNKYAAWLSIALLLAFSANALKQFVVALVMKLYEIFIQKNGAL